MNEGRITRKRGGNARRIVMEFGRYPKENKDALFPLGRREAGDGRDGAVGCFERKRDESVI